MASSSVDIVCPPNEAGVKAEADDSWESPGTELGTEQALKAHPSPQRLQPKEQTLSLGQGLGGLHTSWVRVFSHSCFLSDRGGKAWEACILPRGTCYRAQSPGLVSSGCHLPPKTHLSRAKTCGVLG